MAQTQTKALVTGNIKAVLFDLGDTLINFGEFKRTETVVKAARSAYDYLKQTNQPVRSFYGYILRHIIGLRFQTTWSAMTGKDFDSLQSLKTYGKHKKFDLTPEQYEELHWAWYRTLKDYAKIEPDLGETLAAMKNAGLKLGIVSNTFVNGHALDRHLSEENLIDYFDIRLYSYQVSRRKPHIRIFNDAAARLELDPGQIIFVGDRVDKDVKGAMNAGMHPVLKSAYTNRGKKVPDGVPKIDKISELPDLITKTFA
ncbi:Pyrimidine 5'-nucleotidase YjjG [Anaerohalosphaera lusitana]|uniref:Pyrimidine 5'-nucleotidase YjjG n=1 Tax=Anaerohalosphaera lusitana TaxID=1936003 RepID=A0A1U9NGZ1_9BACT|nr:HAD family hydrolase [Anaerohalosphaera lusitana]AQT67037.1 Pyrimidine 5'-nucleotidase YjjG [Anaerohalosphaera lusitana]